MLTAARDAGVRPWVCLHHFTLPRWFADRGGFVKSGNRQGPWRRHVDFVAEAFGDLVAGWKPVNEPVAHAAAGWLGMGFAPGRNDFGEFAAVLENVHLANLEAAAILRQTGAPVASIHNLSTVHAVGEGALPVAEVFDAVLWGSWLGVLQEGVLRVPGRRPVECSALADAFDQVGFSYYAATGVRANGRQVPYPQDAPVSPLGYGIWAPGLGHVLERLGRELAGTPLLVSEFGLGTDDDAVRDAYLREGLSIVADAITRGIDVRGFFHWTGVDNYEWLHGYDVAFGLFDRDRRARPSLGVLSSEISGSR